MLGFGSGRLTSVRDRDRREVAFKARDPILYPTAQTFHVYKQNKTSEITSSLEHHAQDKTSLTRWLAATAYGVGAMCY